MAVRQVGGVAAVAVAVGEGSADEVDAAVKKWRVVDARVQGGAVPGRLALVGADVDVDVRLAAEVAALVVVKLQVDAVCALSKKACSCASICGAKNDGARMAMMSQMTARKARRRLIMGWVGIRCGWLRR